jgi:hypothetical protein
MGLWRVNDVVCGPLAYFFFELGSNTAANRLPFAQAISLATLVASSAGAGTTAPTPMPAAVEAEPELQVPSVDYRKEWVQLGTYALLADTPADDAKKLQYVYTERKNLEAYLKSGSFLTAQFW